MIRPNSENAISEVGIQRQRSTSHNLQRRGLCVYTTVTIKSSNRIASIGSVWFKFYNTLKGWARVIA